MSTKVGGQIRRHIPDFFLSTDLVGCRRQHLIEEIPVRICCRAKQLGVGNRYAGPLGSLAGKVDAVGEAPDHAVTGQLEEHELLAVAAGHPSRVRYGRIDYSPLASTVSSRLAKRQRPSLPRVKASVSSGRA